MVMKLDGQEPVVGINCRGVSEWPRSIQMRRYE